MRVHVKFFAIFREMIGVRDEWINMPDGTTVERLWDQYAERSPRLAHIRAAFAVNQRLAQPNQVLQEGDEVGFLPPVSGGAGARASKRAEPRKPRKGTKTAKGKPRSEKPGRAFLRPASITRRPLDLSQLIRCVVFPGAGAIVTFTGVVRDNAHGRSVDHLEYEAYPEMALTSMQEIISEIGTRWPQARAAMAHRVGRLKIGDASLIIAVAAPHRPEAYAASRYAIERIKAVLPVWKKEFAADGDYWVEGPLAGQVPPEQAEQTVRESEPPTSTAL
jgi:molybdopterin converting factor subunit 1